MYTQCSNCESIFKLSAEVLRAAGGQVRCGRCGEVFNALARLAESPAAFETGTSVLEMEQRAEGILETVVAVPAEPPAAADEPVDESLAPGTEIAHLKLMDPEDGENSMEFTLPPGELDRIFVERRARGAVKPKFAAAPQSIPPPPHPEDEVPDEIEVISDHRENREPRDHRERTPGGPLVSAAARLQMRGAAQVAARAAPQEDFDFVDSSELPAAPRAYSLWVAAVIFFALLLIMQMVHHNREWLAMHGPFGPLLRSLYSTIGAPVAAPVNLSAYQLRQWGVTGDPAADSTLRVRASILNATAQLVPFPLLRVTLANRYGTKIGTRDFEPNEYMGKPMARLLAPGERIDATLQILDPGKDAEGFEIDVCLHSVDKKIVCAADALAAQSKS